MSLDRVKGLIVFHCDGGCGDSFEADTRDFDDARSDLKRQSWLTKKVADEWCHFCPTCKGSA